MPASPWTDTTDRQLLLIIIELTSPSLPKWDQVAEKMGGAPFTAESVRQHFQKIRKETKGKLEDGGEASPAATPKTTPKATPRKRKAPAANGDTPGKSTGKRKQGKAADDDGESTTVEETKEQPVKAESEE